MAITAVNLNVDLIFIYIYLILKVFCEVLKFNNTSQVFFNLDLEPRFKAISFLDVLAQ